jgi:hypothetical protein
MTRMARVTKPKEMKMAAQKIGKIRFQPGAPYRMGTGDDGFFIKAMCPIDVEHDGALAAQGRFLFDVVTPHPEYTDPRNAFGSAQNDLRRAESGDG